MDMIDGNKSDNEEDMALMMLMMTMRRLRSRRMR